MSLGGQQGQFSNEAELNAALSSPGVASVEKQFFMTGDVARLAFIIAYDEGRSSDPSARSASFAKGRKAAPPFPTADEVLAAVPEERRAAYDALRELRNRSATKIGKKGYMLANNYQLAHIACSAPQTKTALRRIHEIGKEFVDVCCDAALDIVKGLAPARLNAPDGAWWNLQLQGAEETEEETSEGTDETKVAEEEEEVAG